MTLGQRAAGKEPLPLCGHATGPYDVLVRVQGYPRDFLICQACWQPGRSYQAGGWRVDRLYGSDPDTRAPATLPTPCLGCGRRVIRAKTPRLRYITCSAFCAKQASRIRSGAATDAAKSCQECGEAFAGSSHARYCSAACRNRSYRGRRNGP